MLFRITEDRARKIAGQLLPRPAANAASNGPASMIGGHTPELPAGAVVRGRLIVAHVEEWMGSL